MEKERGREMCVIIACIYDVAVDVSEIYMKHFAKKLVRFVSV